MHRITVPDSVISGTRNPIVSLDASRTALLIIDMQNGFIEGPIFRNDNALEIIPGLNRLAASLREAGGLVVHVQHSVSDEPRYRLTEWQDRMTPRDADGVPFLVPGNPAYDIHPDIAVQAEDMRIAKYRFSAMLPNSSDLSDRMQGQGIDTLIIGGTVTNICCESTARDAYMLGYRVAFLLDGCAALSDQEHNAALLSIGRVFGALLTIDQATGLVTLAGAISSL